MESLNKLKAATLAVSLAISGIAMNAGAADSVAVETYNNSNWQTPLAAEFDKIDASGNGLILLNEATKSKAFNAKTFAKADVDHSGSIDQREFVYYRTGAWPVEPPVNLVNAASANSMAVPLTKEIDVPPVAEIEQDTVMPPSGEPQAGELSLPDSGPEPIVSAEKRTVRTVVDDAVITTKAKAAILAADDLKSLQISVETRKGEVILSGFVDSEVARLKAEALVAKIEGVQLVRNSLEVKK